jgi:NAD(P)-dependent dehydrogenase (short-subunit alcohol dehydrogenase family)
LGVGDRRQATVADDSAQCHDRHMATSRTVLITGCSSGIGKSTAERLSRSGWTVYATARRPETLAGLTQCKHLAVDVTDDASMSSAVDAVLAEAGHLDALVNNAGYSLSGAVETLDVDDIRREFETNVFGLVRLSQLVLPAMRSQHHGRIVNIGSMGGKLTFPGGGAYHASKYAVEAFSDALRYEVAGFGVKVVLIEPGLITTNFDDAALASMDLESGGPYATFNRAAAKAMTDAYAGPMARFGGPPEAVAKVVQKALTKRRPKPRYTVTLSAPASIATRKMLGDRGWDLAMRAQFPRPGANAD